MTLRFNAPVVDAIFDAGAEAARHGLPEHACPFPVVESMFMTERERWMHGHRSAAYNAPTMTSCCGD